MWVQVFGSPLDEQVYFQDERILQPWKNEPLQAPKIASVLPRVRDLILKGKYKTALDLALSEAAKGDTKPRTDNLAEHPAFDMRLDAISHEQATDYLRSTDFETGEIKVRWRDADGTWVRRTFVSRPDNVVVQYIEAPANGLINLNLRLDTSMILPPPPPGPPAPGAFIEPGASSIHFDVAYTAADIALKAVYDTEHGTPGYVSDTRVVAGGGTATPSGQELQVRGAHTLMLMTRIDVLPKWDDTTLKAMTASLDTLPADYRILLQRNRAMQAPVIDRVKVDFGGAAQHSLSGEELLTSQRIKLGYNPALLEDMMDMGRYWLYARTGDFPPMWGQANINMNLQISSAVEDNLPESILAYTHWLEGLMPDARVNAKNVFGMRGAVFGIHPTVLGDPSDHFDYSFPHLYWISAGGWLYSPLWDYYLATGDKEFLRDHILPALKEIGLFYQDYLTIKDRDGKFVFVPSYSPENWPSNTDGAPAVLNATMDISVAREVLTHLVEGSELLHTNSEDIPNWKALLAGLPPYLLDEDGALKEWAWPSLAESLDHRHVSHLYGVWPGDEITPDGTPELARAALLADRKRGFGNASAHGLLHRALAGARLKDTYMVDFVLKQLLDQGYVNPSLTTMHNSFWYPAPDVQGALPTLLTEMLVYSRPGKIELLPAVPPSLKKGSISGILCRTDAVVQEMDWDLKARKVDVTILSHKMQSIDLVVGQGIASIEATPAAVDAAHCTGSTHCSVHLEAANPVTLHISLDDESPFEWVNKTSPGPSDIFSRPLPR